MGFLSHLIESRVFICQTKNIPNKQIGLDYALFSFIIRDFFIDSLFL